MEVPAIDRVTQARHLREVDGMARDLIAIMTDETQATIELDVRVVLPESVREHLRAAEELRQESARAQAQAAKELRPPHRHCMRPACRCETSERHSECPTSVHISWSHKFVMDDGGAASVAVGCQPSGM
jgi:hypothetical protein